MENAEMAWSAADADANTDLADFAEPAAFADTTQPELDDFSVAEALCPTCGELLAWHDEFASCHRAGAATPEPGPAGAEEFGQEPPRPAARSVGQSKFAYELGRRVQAMPALTAEVIWRGQLRERHPATGLVHRVNVYRLNDGFWDCYREEDLQAA